MNREEHLEWAKTRALAYLDVGDWQQAIASMGSDLGKHDETKPLQFLAAAAIMDAVTAADPVAETRRWIEGFR